MVISVVKFVKNYFLTNAIFVVAVVFPHSWTCSYKRTCEVPINIINRL